MTAERANRLAKRWEGQDQLNRAGRGSSVQCCIDRHLQSAEHGVSGFFATTSKRKSWKLFQGLEKKKLVCLLCCLHLRFSFLLFDLFYFYCESAVPVYIYIYIQMVANGKTQKPKEGSQWMVSQRQLLSELTIQYPDFDKSLVGWACRN